MAGALFCFPFSLVLLFLPAIAIRQITLMFHQRSAISSQFLVGTFSFTKRRSGDGGGRRTVFSSSSFIHCCLSSWNGRRLTHFWLMIIAGPWFLSIGSSFPNRPGHLVCISAGIIGRRNYRPPELSAAVKRLSDQQPVLRPDVDIIVKMLTHFALLLIFIFYSSLAFLGWAVAGSA